jgi:two-component system chemotaxis response regulator CheY
MQLTTSGQIEQEQAIETSGLRREEITLLCEECTGRLVEVERDLLDIAEDRASASQELISRVTRAFHSVEGAAAYLLHEPMKRLSHAAERVLGEVREGEVVLTANLLETLLCVVSRLKEMAEDVDRELEVDFHIELGSLEAILKHKSSARGESIDPAGAAPTVSKRSSSADRLKMLLVEDELTSRLVLQDLLSKYGDCHVAVNGNEAVEAFSSALLAKKGYDLICMDVRMPEMEGTEAVRQIRAIEEREQVFSSKGAKIFMTTSIHDLKTITSSFKALCDVYLFKPIDGAKLDEHLRAFRLVDPEKA